VARALPGQWLPGHTVVPVLRSGAYITHDNGTYERMTPFNRIPGEGTLDAALELWAQVLSTPEPGLAIVGMGKRDAPFDEGFPVPLSVRRGDAVEPLAGAECTRLNDQHAYLTVAPGSVKPADLIRFGISHPCTAFDRWRVIPLVDDHYIVTDLLRTYF
jgi:D-serine deaminase-like pyridoxal phosphate-dependent protein